MVEAGGDLGHPTEHLVHHAFDVAELSLDDGHEQRVEELVNGPPALPEKTQFSEINATLKEDEPTAGTLRPPRPESRPHCRL